MLVGLYRSTKSFGKSTTPRVDSSILERGGGGIYHYIVYVYRKLNWAYIFFIARRLHSKPGYCSSSTDQFSW